MNSTASRAPRSVARRAIAVALLMIVSIVGVVLVAWTTPMGHEALGELRARAKPGFILLAVALMTLAVPATALRWRALCPVGAIPRFRGLGPLTASMFAGTLLNFAFPGPVGDVAASAMVRTRFSVPLPEALAALVVSRIVGVTTAAALASMGLLLAPTPLPDALQPVLFGVALALAGGVAVVIALAVAPDRPLALARRAVEQLRGAGRARTAGHAAASGVVRVLEALVETARRGRAAFTESIVWSLSGHFAVSLGLLVACWGVGASPSWAGIVLTYGLATAGAFILFLVPGSQLGWDVSFGMLLVGAAGLDLAPAAAVTVLVRLQQLGLMVVGGVALPVFGSDLADVRRPDADLGEV